MTSDVCLSRCGNAACCDYERTRSRDLMLHHAADTWMILAIPVHQFEGVGENHSSNLQPDV